MCQLGVVLKDILIFLILSLGKADDVCTKCRCDLNSLRCSSTTLRPPLNGHWSDFKDLIILHSNVTSVFDEKLNFLHLQNIYVRNSSVGRVSETSLGSLKNLTEFEISYSNIEKLFPKVFFSNANLQRIDLSNNKIENLPVGIFSKLRNIKYLYLSNNKLKIIHKGTFASNPKLTRLDISCNEIRSIEIGAFNFSSVLDVHASESNVYIDLSRNALSKITDGVFSSCTYLKELDVSHNQLGTLRTGMFFGLYSLRVLDLQNNNLTEIPRSVFSSCFNLSTLLLSRNDIKYLHPDSFKGLRRIRELHLDGNALKGLETAFQIPLPALVHLDLSRNRIRSIRNVTFSGCTNLSYLDLSHNSISNIENYTFAAKNPIEKLRLDHNTFTRLGCSTFVNLPFLNTLSIVGNRLERIQHCNFSPLGNLTKLSLSLSEKCECERFVLTSLKERGVAVTVGEVSVNCLGQSDGIEIGTEAVTVHISLKENENSQNRYVKNSNIELSTYQSAATVVESTTERSVEVRRQEITRKPSLSGHDLDDGESYTHSSHLESGLTGQGVTQPSEVAEKNPAGGVSTRPTQQVDEAQAKRRLDEDGQRANNGRHETTVTATPQQEELAPNLEQGAGVYQTVAGALGGAVAVALVVAGWRVAARLKRRREQPHLYEDIALSPRRSAGPSESAPSAPAPLTPRAQGDLYCPPLPPRQHRSHFGEASTPPDVELGLLKGEPCPSDPRGFPPLSGAALAAGCRVPDPCFVPLELQEVLQRLSTSYEMPFHWGFKSPKMQLSEYVYQDTFPTYEVSP